MANDAWKSVQTSLYDDKHMNALHVIPVLDVDMQDFRLMNSHYFGSCREMIFTTVTGILSIELVTASITCIYRAQLLL